MKQFLILALLLLVACQANQLRDSNETGPVVVIDDTPARPEFNRTDLPPEPEPEEEIIKPIPPNQSVFLVRHEHSAQFRVPLGYAFGDAYPILTKEDLALLRPAPIQTGDNRFRGYRQLLTFGFENATGNVTYIVDEEREPEYVGSALYFREDLPYMAYTFALNDRPFYDPAVVGSDLVILGSEYQVMEATNFTLFLAGKNVEQYLRITNGSRLETNRKTISDSLVYYDGFGFTIELRAPDLDEDGFYLRAGETLSSRLAEVFDAEALIGAHLDVRYEGLEEAPQVPLLFKVRDDIITLEWDDVRVPLLGISDGELLHGRDHMLHFKECDNSSHACVQLEDTIMLVGQTSPNEFLTRTLRLSSIDEDERKIIFRDTQTSERVSVDYGGGSRYEPPHAILPFLDNEYLLYVPNATIPNPQNMSNNISVPLGLSVDLNGNRRVAGDIVPIIIGNGVRVIVDGFVENRSTNNHTMNITIETAPFDYTQQRYTDGTINKEMLLVQAVYENDKLLVRVPQDPSARRGYQNHDLLWDQRLHIDPEEEYSIGMSPWGSEVVLELDEEERAQQSTEDLQVTVPFVQRFALVSIGTLE